MATIDTHPLTGVKLNPVLVERPALDCDDAVTAWILRLEGEKYQTIAARLGTNTHRIGEVFRGERYPEAQAIALEKIGRPSLF